MVTSHISQQQLYVTKPRRSSRRHLEGRVQATFHHCKNCLCGCQLSQAWLWPGAAMTEHNHLEDFHAAYECCEACQALAAAATQTHQQHVAPWLAQHTADTAHMLHRKQKHGQVHWSFAHACSLQYSRFSSSSAVWWAPPESMG